MHGNNLFSIVFDDLCKMTLIWKYVLFQVGKYMCKSPFGPCTSLDFITTKNLHNKLGFSLLSRPKLSENGEYLGFMAIMKTAF